LFELNIDDAKGARGLRMPTGIEEVGLVLAIWPIAMGALKLYAEERGVS
jgi:hypothetical protein